MVLVGSSYGDWAERSQGFYLNIGEIISAFIGAVVTPTVVAGISFLIDKSKERRSRRLMKDRVGRDLVNLYADFLSETSPQKWRSLKLGSPDRSRLRGAQDSMLLERHEALTAKAIEYADQVNENFSRTVFRQGKVSRPRMTVRYADRFIRALKLLLMELGYDDPIIGRGNQERKDLLQGLREELGNGLSKSRRVSWIRFQRKVTTRL